MAKLEMVVVGIAMMQKRVKQEQTLLKDLRRQNIKMKKDETKKVVRDLK